MPDDFKTQIKKLATATHSAVTALIEETLREGLARRRHRRRAMRVTLPTYGKQGPLPGVDIDDTASMLDVMESGR